MNSACSVPNRHCKARNAPSNRFDLLAFLIIKSTPIYGVQKTQKYSLEHFRVESFHITSRHQHSFDARTIFSVMRWTSLFFVHLGIALATHQQGQIQNGKSQIPIGAGAKRPNIVFILTDDQDYRLNSLDYMPFVKKHLIEKGTHYQRHFCTIAVCCPSRVSLWTGKAAHNTNVTDVNPPYGKYAEHGSKTRIILTTSILKGGFPKFVSQGLNENFLPVWLQEAGYNTYYTGKLFNAHTVDNYHSPYVKGFTGSVSCYL